MAIARTPLHKFPLSSLPIRKEHARPLLDRNITLYFREEDARLNQVITTVWEIYQKCQKTISEEFGGTRFIIRGSSVTNLYSKEPIGDIDIHATIDLTHLPEADRVGKGYAFKWAVLKGIREIIAEKISAAAPKEKILTPSTEYILFQEENNLIGSRSTLPFNIHTIRLGNIPVEFTMFNVFKPVIESVRNYDFNSGALQLRIEEGDKMWIDAYTPDISITLEEIKDRALSCSAPEEITRKALSRYLAKLVVSGYYDKDKELLSTFVEGLKKGKEEKILAKEIMDEIIAHFHDKGVNPLSALLALWLLPKPTPFLKVIIAQASEALKSTLSEEPITQLKALSTLIQKEKKAECSWYLLMQAKQCRKVIHRGVESLQLEMLCYPMFAKTPSEASVFVIVPVLGLEKLFENEIPQAFLDLCQMGLHLQIHGDETKVLLQRLFQDILTKPCLFPVLSAAMNLFDIHNQRNFSKIFIEWIETTKEPENLRIPLPILVKALENIQQGQGVKQGTVLSVLKRIHALISKEALCSFESLPLQRIMSFYTEFFLKKENWGSLPTQDQAIIIDYAKALLAKHGKTETLLGYKKGVDALLCERILNILKMVYGNKLVGGSEGVLGAKLFAEMGYPQISLKFLQTIATREESLQGTQLQKIFDPLAESYPLEYAIFLKENAPLIQQKTTAFPYIILPFLEKILSKKVSSELTAVFADLIDLFCTEEERKKIIKTLFIGAAKGQLQSTALYEELSNHFSLSCSYFDWLEEMDKNDLALLSKQRDFTLYFATDPEFTVKIIDKALLVKNIDLIISGGFHLAKTDPDGCLYAAHTLNTLRDSVADSSVLFASIKILVKLLQTHADLITTNERCRPLIEARLEDLSIYLSSASAPKAFEGELFTTLQEFHKEVSLHTLDNPFWQLFWLSLSRLGKPMQIKDWVLLKDLAKTFGSMNPKGNILTLIDTFSLDPLFIYELALQLNKLPKDIQGNFAPVITLAFQKGRDSLLGCINIPPHPEMEEVVEFVDSIRRSLIAKKTIESFMDFCSFHATFSKSSEEIKILRKLTQLHKEPAGKTELEKLTTQNKILFLFAKRARQRKDLESIAQIKNCYREWGRNILTNKYLSPEEIQAECCSWKKLLQEIFADPAVNKRVTIDSLELHCIEFYALFLGEIIKHPCTAQDRGPSQADSKMKKWSFSRILELIDFLSEKKLIKSTYCLQSLMKEVKNLEQNQIELLAHRFILMATNILEEVQKSPIQQEDLTPFAFLLNFVSSLIEAAEAPGKKTISRRAILQLLELTRTIFPNFTGDKLYLNTSIRIICSLETLLSKNELIAYYSSWTQSIVLRKETVHFMELSLWATLTTKVSSWLLDMLYPSEGAKNPFADKLIITKEYLNEPMVIRNFLEIFNQAFTRFSPIAVSGALSDVSVGVNIFHLFYIYSPCIEVILLNLKTSGKHKSELITLQRLYKSILIKYLQTPKALASTTLVLSIFPYIFTHDRISTPADDVRPLQLIAQNLRLIKKKEYNSSEKLKQAIELSYRQNRKIIEEVLSAIEISELEFLIFELHKETSGGAGQSHP